MRVKVEEQLKNHKNRLRRILVIRRDNIGDLACTTPAFAALRKAYPDAEIGALVNSYNSDVLRGNLNIDNLFVYQKLKHASGLTNRFKALVQRLKLIVKLRFWRPDITILAKSGYDRHGLNFARQIGAKNVIGFVSDDFNQEDKLPSIQIKTPRFSDLHEVEAVNQLLAPLGIDYALGPLQVFAANKAVDLVCSGLPKSQTRIALHISAREPERRWGNSNFIGLLKYIEHTRPETQILIFWSPGKSNDPYHPGDDEAALELIQAVQNRNVFPMPTQSLTELIAALSLCDLFIGADGGAMHLAVGLNMKVLALFENQPSKLAHWYPWKVRHRIVHSQDPDRPEVTHISQNDVAQALNELD